MIKENGQDVLNLFLEHNFYTKELDQKDRDKMFVFLVEHEVDLNTFDFHKFFNEAVKCKPESDYDEDVHGTEIEKVEIMGMPYITYIEKGAFYECQDD